MEQRTPREDAPARDASPAPRRQGDLFFALVLVAALYAIAMGALGVMGAPTTTAAAPAHVTGPLR